MTRGQGLLLAGLALAAIAVWVALLSQLMDASSTSGPDGVAGLATDPPVSPTPPPSASVVEPAPASLEPEPTASATATAQPEPPAVTDPPEVGTGGRAAFLVFLARMDAAQATAQDLNAELREAGEASDQAAVRRTATDMADLVERERGWLDDNPPDPCFADAHTAADDLLAAYGSVAVAATAWADASGLDVLTALAELYDAVETATAAAADLRPALDAVSCAA